MPSFFAHFLAVGSDRDAIARISISFDFIMPGRTFSQPMRAVEITPQRTGLNPGIFYCALPWSNPAIPFVAAVFPEAALAGAELGVAVDRLDFHDVFRHLVAELA